MCYTFYRFQADELNTTLSTVVNDTSYSSTADTDELNTTLSTVVNDTSYSSTADTDVGIFYPLVIILPVLFLLGLIIIFVAWKMRHRLKKTHNNNGCKITPFLISMNKMHSFN